MNRSRHRPKRGWFQAEHSAARSAARGRARPDAVGQRLTEEAPHRQQLGADGIAGAKTVQVPQQRGPVQGTGLRTGPQVREFQQ